MLPAGWHCAKAQTFVRWSICANVLASATSVMSTHALLAAVTMRPSELAVTVNYVSKDMVGQLVGAAVAGTTAYNADRRPMGYITACSALLSTATILEACTPLLTEAAFIPVGAAANVAKNVAWIGSGAMTAKAVREFSTAGDSANAYAKLASVNTVASTVGLAGGMAVVAFVPSHTVRVMFVLPLCSVLHMYAWRRAVSQLSGDK